MTPKQLEVMKMQMNPMKKIILIAMLEDSNLNRKRLSEMAGVDARHVSTVTKKLASEGFIETYKIPDSVSVRYVVNI